MLTLRRVVVWDFLGWKSDSDWSLRSEGHPSQSRLWQPYPLYFPVNVSINVALVVGLGPLLEDDPLLPLMDLSDNKLLFTF